MRRATTILLLCCLLASAAFMACSKNGKDEDVKTVGVMLVDGAPLLSMTNMLSNAFVLKQGYEIAYTRTNDSDLLIAALLNKEPDFAIAPVNVAAMMFNNGSGYRMAAVTIWGIMHIVTDQEAASLHDLKGETIVAFGKSGTPGITLRSILRQQNIDYTEPDSTDFVPDPEKVHIVYLTAASDVRDAVATGMMVGQKKVQYALLPEPVATAVTGFAANAGRPGFVAKINLQAEWAEHNQEELYPQAALIFHERLLEEDADFVDKFIAMAELSALYADTDPTAAGDLAVSLGSTAIPNGTVVGNAHAAGRLPIRFTYAAEAKTAVNRYLQAIMEENAGLIGGTMPSDQFYYEKEE